MEVFRTAGVEQDIREAAFLLAENHGILQVETLTKGDGKWLVRESTLLGNMPGSARQAGASAARYDLEPVLLRAARALGADIRFGTELVLRAGRDGVTA